MRADPSADEPRIDEVDEVDDAAIDLEAGPEAGGERLDKWLATRLVEHSRSRLQQWIADGFVTVDGRAATLRQPVWAGDRVRVVPQASADATAFRAEDLPLAIVHEDASLFVVDKPPGLVVHPAAGHWGGTLLNGLLWRDPALAGLPRAGIVHRLDKDTSGLMVVARTATAQTDLVRQLQARSVGRGYLALVDGTPPPSGRVDLAIGRDPRDRLKMAAFTADRAIHAKPAATRFETLETKADADGRTVSLVACRLETGRTHQIRVHLQAIGHPLVGDATYGATPRRASRVGFDRQALHAWRLALVHPATGAPMRWIATPPADLRALANGFGIDLVRWVDVLAMRDD